MRDVCLNVGELYRPELGLGSKIGRSPSKLPKKKWMCLMLLVSPKRPLVAIFPPNSNAANTASEDALFHQCPRSQVKGCGVQREPIRRKLLLLSIKEAIGRGQSFQMSSTLVVHFFVLLTFVGVERGLWCVQNSSVAPGIGKL